MSPTFENELIDSLKRIDDDDTTSLVSEQAFVELEQAILAIPLAPARRRRSGLTRRRVAARQPMFALVAVATVAAIVLAATGVFSGSGPAGVQPADAAILQGAFRTLAHPGTIVIESYRGIARENPKPPASKTTTRFAMREIIDTPDGRGAKNELNLEVPNGSTVEIGEVNGNNELYDPKNDTVYISSQFGSDITQGPRPGTYIYTLPKDFFPVGVSGPVTPPLTITAAQANGLRDGTADVIGPLPDKGRPAASHLKVITLVRNPVETAEIRAQLKAGKFKVSGMTTTAGRRAIRLVGIHGNRIREYDVAPGTYVPIREVVRQPGNVTIVTYSEYRVLPATPANARLLNLALRYPNARVDRNHADYLAAEERLLHTR